MKNKTSKEVVMALLFLLVGGILLHFNGGIDWVRLIVMTICGAGGMLLLIFLEWFFLVRNKKDKTNSSEKTETVENNKETEKIMPYSQNDICVMCGDYCPEGRHVCERCEKENK